MNIAMILGAGSGTRMGNVSTPKQFLNVYNKPLIVHTIESFEVHDDIDMIVVVTNKEYIDQVKMYVKQFDLSKVKYVVEGGDSRQKSVFHGLEKIKEFAKDDDLIIIHDAARPLISKRIISDNIKFGHEYKAVDTVIPSADTIIVSLDNKIINDVPLRKNLYLGQTPQSFEFKLIYETHLWAKENNILDASDDCQLVMKNGLDVHLVNGDKMNFKITTFDDLMMLKSMLRMGKSEVN